jgi:hypothetical protein
MKTCAPVLLQSYRSTVVPLAVPPPLISMHLPSAWSVLPAWTTVHCWAFVPLHVYTWTGVKSVLFAPLTSTHSPWYPVIGPVVPVGGVVPPPPLVEYAAT